MPTLVALTPTYLTGFTAANWVTNGARILQPYEISVNSDDGLQKRGDGATAWSSLPYTNGDSFVNPQSAAYTLTLLDAGAVVTHPVGDNNARTFTIPANSAVAFPVGTQIQFTNEINTVTIAITTDTLKFGASGTGSRSLAVGGTARLIKLTSTIWRIVGSAELT